jgi:hypothetical protein
VGRVDTAKTSRFAMLSAEHVFRMDAGAGIRDEGWLSGGSSLVGAGIMVQRSCSRGEQGKKFKHFRWPHSRRHPSRDDADSTPRMTPTPPNAFTTRDTRQPPPMSWYAHTYVRVVAHRMRLFVRGKRVWRL